MGLRLNFTKAGVERVACPVGADRVWAYDARTPGLALLVTARGARSFYVYRKVKGRPQRVRLGGFPELTVEQARGEARKVVGDIERGADPMAERRKARASMTLAELFIRFRDKHGKQHKRTWAQDEAAFTRYFGRPDGKPDPTAEKPKGRKRAAPTFPGWRTRGVNTMTQDAVRDLHADIGRRHGKYAANRLLSLLSAMFNFARLPNPAEGVKPFREEERERFVLPDEMPRLLVSLAHPSVTPDARDVILLELLTGARKSNVIAMRWSDVSLERGVWTIPGAQSKNGKPMTVPLGPAAQLVLSRRLEYNASPASPYVFAGRGKSGHLASPDVAWFKVRERAGLADVRMHDLRRTFGSWQAAAGASLPIIGRTLGHQNLRTTAIYARLNLDPVKQSVHTATAAMAAHMPAGLLPRMPSPNSSDGSGA
jgi:integrase